MSLAPDALERFVAGLVAEPERWTHLVRHAEDARVYELIWDDADVNAWVICWSEDQDTGFHDHDVSAAAIAVISGHVREDRLRLDGSPESRIAGPGSVLSVPPVAIHRVLHAGEGPAVTIHAYSPPLTRTGAYRVGPGGELLRESLSFEEELRAEEQIWETPGYEQRRTLREDDGQAGAGRRTRGADARHRRGPARDSRVRALPDQSLTV